MSFWRGNKALVSIGGGCFPELLYVYLRRVRNEWVTEGEGEQASCSAAERSSVNAVTCWAPFSPPLSNTAFHWSPWPTLTHFGVCASSSEKPKMNRFKWENKYGWCEQNYSHEQCEPVFIAVCGYNSWTSPVPPSPFLSPEAGRELQRWWCIYT